MINKKIDELFTTIYNSNEYKSYYSIKEKLNNNKKIINLIEEIKKLQKKSTMLEYNKDINYKEIDKIINNKLKELEEYPIYNEYLNKKEELNDILSTSINIIEKYLDNIIK